MHLKCTSCSTETTVDPPYNMTATGPQLDPKKKIMIMKWLYAGSLNDSRIKCPSCKVTMNVTYINCYFCKKELEGRQTKVLQIHTPYEYVPYEQTQYGRVCDSCDNVMTYIYNCRNSPNEDHPMPTHGLHDDTLFYVGTWITFTSNSGIVADKTLDETFYPMPKAICDGAPIDPSIEYAIPISDTRYLFTRKTPDKVTVDGTYSYHHAITGNIGKKRKEEVDMMLRSSGETRVIC